jgi:hypothetical protein
MWRRCAAGNGKDVAQNCRRRVRNGDVLEPKNSIYFKPNQPSLQQKILRDYEKVNMNFVCEWKQRSAILNKKHRLRVYFRTPKIAMKLEK